MRSESQSFRCHGIWSPRLQALRVGLTSLFVCLTAVGSPVGTQITSTYAGLAVTQGAAGFDFALIGDLAYTPAQEPQLRNMMADLASASSLAFVVHDGDLWGQPTPNGGTCADTRYAERLALFQASPQPLVYTPGDNDWADCHLSGTEPEDRLRLLRDTFFSDEQSLGQQRLPLTRQSLSPAFAAYRENVRWSVGGVTFITLHVVGSNNNLGRTPEGDLEWAERTAANLAWLHDGFLEARRSNSRGVMIIQQAAPWARRLTEAPYTERQHDQPNGFSPLVAALMEETAAYDRPVVLVHGDNHYFMVDKPLLRVAGVAPIGNFTRVQTFGAPDHHWVLVSVRPDDPSVFSFSPRIVSANLSAPE